MKNILLVVILCSLLFIINAPKVQYEIMEEDTKDCRCLGFSRSLGLGDVCYGITYSCKYISKDSMADIRINTMYGCRDMDCAKTRRYLGVPDISQEVSEASTRKSGVNLLLIIDTSFSMEGQNIINTRDAAIKLVEELTPQDHSAIITFNNRAEMIHDFSADKTSLIEAIQSIRVGEDTRYSPALEMGKDMFERLRNGYKRDFIIFLSDGDPLDEPEKIKELSEGIKEQGIEIYTVRMSDQKEENADDILNDMASPLNDNGIKGFFVTVQGESLYKSFKKIYDNVIERDYYFHVINNNGREDYSPGENIYMDFSVLSIDSSNKIPGATVVGSEVFCIDNANVTAIVANGAPDKHEVEFKHTQNGYIGNLEGLKKGNYSVYLNVSVNIQGNESCKFEDYQKVGKLVVDETIKEYNCSEAYCSDYESAAMDMRIFNEDNFRINTFRDNRLLIAIDTSESMRSDKIDSAKESLKYLAQLFSRNYDVSLVQFSDEATLLHPFTGDFESLLRRIDDIKVGKTTRYLPLFDKANYIYEPVKDGKNHLLFISDGINWDNNEYDDLMRSVNMLVDKGVCIHVLGFGINRALSSQDLLKEIAEVSERKLSCGGYDDVYTGEMFAHFIEFYNELRSDDSDLDVALSLSSTKVSKGEPLLVNVKVFSEYNAFEFPSHMEFSDSMAATGKEDFCFPEPMVTINVSKDGEAAYESEMEYFTGIGFSDIITLLDEGEYEITVSAEVSDGNETCILHGTENVRVSVDERSMVEEKSYAPILVVLDILIILGVVYIILSWKKLD